MGLLDALQSPDAQLGLGLLAAAGPSATPMSFGQRLNGVMQQFQAQKIAEEERKQKAAMQALQAKLIESQIGETQAQGLQRQAAAQEAQRKAAEAARVQGVVRSAFMPVSGSDANAVSGVTGPRPEALNAVGSTPPVNYQALIAQGVPPELAKSLADARNYGRDKVARTVKGVGPDGREYEYQVDDYGTTVGEGKPQYRSPISVNQGNKTTLADPYSMRPVASFQTFQDPNSVASNAVAWSNNALARQRLGFDMQKDARDAASGQLVQGEDGSYYRVGKDNRASAILAPTGVQPLIGKGGGMTEDQGKATGWLVQAENAYKNMLAAGFDKSGKPASAAYPGPADALENTWIGGTANAFRSADRQKFVQSSSSLSEALLRAATGAGVNKEEAAQKVRELTPSFMEDEETTRQKMAAIPLYIESLKVRAGPGSKKAASIFDASSSPNHSATLRFNPKTGMLEPVN